MRGLICFKYPTYSDKVQRYPSSALDWKNWRRIEMGREIQFYFWHCYYPFQSSLWLKTLIVLRLWQSYFKVVPTKIWHKRRFLCSQHIPLGTKATTVLRWWIWCLQGSQPAPEPVKMGSVSCPSAQMKKTSLLSSCEAKSPCVWHLCRQADWTHCHVLSVAWLSGSWHQQVGNTHNRATYTSFYLEENEFSPISPIQKIFLLTEASPYFWWVQTQSPTQQGRGYLSAIIYTHHPSHTNNNLVTIQSLVKQEKSTSAWITPYLV